MKFKDFFEKTFGSDDYYFDLFEDEAKPLYIEIEVRGEEVENQIYIGSYGDLDEICEKYDEYEIIFWSNVVNIKDYNAYLSTYHFDLFNLKNNMLFSVGTTENGENTLLSVWAKHNYGDVDFCIDTLDIPSILDNKPITCIGDGSQIISQIHPNKVIIPSTVEKIANWAFYEEYIGTIEFESNNNLLSIGEYAFLRNRITKIDIPNSVSHIGVGAFEDCENLKTVSLPNSLEDLYGSMFAGCTSLKTVYMPKSIKRIRSFAFSGCKDVTIYYDGTVEEWSQVVFSVWNKEIQNFTIVCTNGVYKTSTKN